MQQVKRVIDVTEVDVVENLLRLIKNCVPEMIRRFDASNGMRSYEELKMILLHEAATEAVAKK